MNMDRILLCFGVPESSRSYFFPFIIHVHHPSLCLKSHLVARPTVVTKLLSNEHSARSAPTTIGSTPAQVHDTSRTLETTEYSTSRRSHSPPEPDHQFTSAASAAFFCGSRAARLGHLSRSRPELRPPVREVDVACCTKVAAPRTKVNRSLCGLRLFA